MKYTRFLKLILQNYKTTLNESEYSSFENHVHSMMNKIIQDLSSISSVTERGQRLHQLLDIEVQSQTTNKVTCQKGCSHCCHFPVEVTSDDIEVLLEGRNYSKCGPEFT